MRAKARSRAKARIRAMSEPAQNAPFEPVTSVPDATIDDLAVFARRYRFHQFHVVDADAPASAKRAYREMHAICLALEDAKVVDQITSIARAAARAEPGASAAADLDLQSLSDEELGAHAMCLFVIAFVVAVAGRLARAGLQASGHRRGGKGNRCPPHRWGCTRRRGCENEEERVRP